MFCVCGLFGGRGYIGRVVRVVGFGGSLSRDALSLRGGIGLRRVARYFVGRYDVVVVVGGVVGFVA